MNPPTLRPLAEPAAAQTAAPLAARLRNLLASLEHGLLERDVAARAVLLAALAGEHVLLIGPPGTAKSELARRLQRCFSGAHYFERLLTRFSTPEELFGPLSLKALEDDRYERLTEGYLPTAGVAFLDEVFKANSAILNALLTLLNEREFDNGAGRLRTPLVSVVGASNEGPVEDALMAFFDRFLLRVPVLPVSDDGFAALLQLGDTVPPPAQPLTPDDRAGLTATAPTVALPDAVLQALQAARAWLQTQTIAVSDRRWRQLVRLLQVQAASEGRTAVDLPDLWLLPLAVAPEPDAVPRVALWVAEHVLQVRADDATGLARAVEAFERQLDLEQRANPDEADSAAGKMALAQAMSPRGEPEGSGMTRLMSQTLEAQLVQRYSPAHVAARVAQLDEVLAGARPRRVAAAQAHQQLAAQLAGRLWCPPSLVRGWLAVLADSHDSLAQLVARGEAARAGFAALPLDDQAPPQAPAPLSLA